MARRLLRALPAVLPLILALAVPTVGRAAEVAVDPAAYPPAHEETRQLVALVDAAADLVSEQGAAKACAAFRQEGTRWRHGEVYVFVNDLEGAAVCHPTRPDLEGRNVLDLRDPYGKPIVRAFQREVESGGSGWVHYLWPRPGEGTNFVWKSTYVRRAESPDGRAYLVGSGRYLMPMERLFVVEQVGDAVDLLQAQGTKAFPTLRDRASGFRFYDSYVFVMDGAGVQLVNAGFPEYEGKDMLDTADPDGVVIGREILARLADHDAAWIEYKWPRPGDQVPAKKSAFVRKVALPDGRTVYVGAGLYGG